ncbi:MAG: M50 family metallopeptidase [bacterium]
MHRARPGEDEPATGAPSRRTVLMALGAFAVSLILWNVPIVGFVLYPFKIFVTFIHEASHGIAAIITGGNLVEFAMYPDTGGYAISQGGNRFIVASAGYLGSSLFGGLMILGASKRNWEKPILFSLGCSVAILTILFLRNWFGIMWGAIIAIFLLGAAIKGRGAVLSFFVNFLAIQSGLYALYDINTLFAISLRHRSAETDALTLQRLTHIPAVFWAILWGAISIAILTLFLRLAIRSGKRR